ESEEWPRRRTKTRSKQKNIKRDTRSEEVKQQVAARRAALGENSARDWYTPTYNSLTSGDAGTGGAGAKHETLPGKSSAPFWSREGAAARAAARKQNRQNRAIEVEDQPPVETSPSEVAVAKQSIRTKISPSDDSMQLDYLAELGIVSLPGREELEHASREDFDTWLRGRLCDGALGERFPETCHRVAEAACSWRSRFPPPLWGRLARDNCSTLIKEAREAVPTIAFVQDCLAELDPTDGPITIVDLCSGLGFLGMFLAELLPAARVHGCVLVDQAWPLKGGVPEPQQSKKHRTRLNWDHIYNLPWPVPLVTRRSDLKLPSTQAQILSRILEPAPGPVVVLGIHLCGILAIRAVETFNIGPKCVAFALKPCCLPPLQYAKSQTRWTLGTHTFAAAEVCARGKYNKNVWNGPAKATLAPRFRMWSSNLFRGLLAERKECLHVELVAGHYQDTYLFGRRQFSSKSPKLPEELSAEASPQQIARRILEASEAHEVLGVPTDVSIRQLRRRWTALAHALGNESSECIAAFQKIKDAFDEIRSMRRSSDDGEDKSTVTIVKIAVSAVHFNSAPTQHVAPPASPHRRSADVISETFASGMCSADDATSKGSEPAKESTKKRLALLAIAFCL
ncbi:unnamed protein product, partial [Symbiodinium microadriaticum]